ncbi:ABC transporter permease [Longispora sp. NPDC051575]|uniref:ABC transporter permease n=1 Tax=Longispora sp. NPDC051575 TaxID=3154943 RepID=UPI003437F012
MDDTDATTRTLRPARLSPGDVARVASGGLRTRPLRVVLSALGIAIGIGAMVSVIGVSASSRAELTARLDRLGTNLLTVTPGKSLFGETSRLPKESVAMVRRIGPVTTVSATGSVAATVRRTDRIPDGETGGLSVRAARTDLLDTVGGSTARGVWLNAATAHYPATVLGATAARRLGVTTPDARTQVWLGNRWFAVIGVLSPVDLAPELDTAALVGFDVAERYLAFDGHPSVLYERSADTEVEQVRAVLPRTVNPQHPEEVAVSRPSDALSARAAADTTFTGLILGLGAVALLVGGVGIANTMVISVLERRGEVGLRRALGATRAQIAVQFLAESLLLSLLGGAAGAALGAAVTIGYAALRDWPTDVPAWSLAGGVAATLAIGTLAGLYPAVRAARLAPTEALGSG